jgi:hypothetical protein
MLASELQCASGMEIRPAGHCEWPEEIRALYDAVTLAEARQDHTEGAWRLDHLIALARQGADVEVAGAARTAFFELAVRYAPEQVQAVLFHGGGRRAFDLAVRALRSPVTDGATRVMAEELIAATADRYPPEARG